MPGSDELLQSDKSWLTTGKDRISGAPAHWQSMNPSAKKQTGTKKKSQKFQNMELQAF